MPNPGLPVFPTWAVESTYPAGANPWNGQPIKIKPAGDYFNPNTAIAGEELNYELNAFTAPLSLCVTIALDNWGPATPLSSAMAMNSSTVLDVIAWDDVARMWIALAHTPTNMAFSLQDGSDWFSNIAPPSNQYYAVASHPAGSGLLLLAGGNNHLQWLTYNAAATDTGSQLGATFIGGGVAMMHVASSKIVVVAYDSTNHNAVAGASHGTADGTTLDTLTGSLPSTWTTSGNLISSFQTWAYGPANDMVVGFGGTTPGTNPSRLLHVTWNGSAFTFTDVSIPAGISNGSIVGCAYNATQALWGVMVYGGTNSTLYTSPDLIAWTASSFPPGQAGGLACVGPYWITAISNQLLTVTSWRAWASTDGVTFTPLGSPFRGSLFAAATKMSQGPGNVAMWSATGAALSKRIE